MEIIRLMTDKEIDTFNQIRESKGDKDGAKYIASLGLTKDNKLVEKISQFKNK